MIIVTLEDAIFTHYDIYIAYIHFINAFEFIGYTRLLAIMENSSYPKDALENIDKNPTTFSFYRNDIEETSFVQSLEVQSKVMPSTPTSITIISMGILA